MLILGSSSNARKELLSSVGLIPDKVEIPGVDESLKVKESPKIMSKNSFRKAHAISRPNKSFLITADTIVTVGRRVLLKTSDETRAKEYLRLLSGRRHSVSTAFCVKHNGLVNLYLVKTFLKMRLLTQRMKLMVILIQENGWVVLELIVFREEQKFFSFYFWVLFKCYWPSNSKLIRVLNGLGYF